MVILTNQQETGLKNIHNTYILERVCWWSKQLFLLIIGLEKNQRQKILLKKYYEQAATEVHCRGHLPKMQSS